MKIHTIKNTLFDGEIKVFSHTKSSVTLTAGPLMTMLTKAEARELGRALLAEGQDAEGESANG